MKWMHTHSQARQANKSNFKLKKIKKAKNHYQKIIEKLPCLVHVVSFMYVPQFPKLSKKSNDDPCFSSSHKGQMHTNAIVNREIKNIVQKSPVSWFDKRSREQI